jgi:hypothetical protein
VDELVRGAALAWVTREGEEVSIAVEEVGTGVGYVVCSSNASRFLLRGLGRAGEEEKGSNAGSRDVVGLFGAGFGETVVSERVVEEAMVDFVLSYLGTIAGDCGCPTGSAS